MKKKFISVLLSLSFLLIPFKLYGAGTTGAQFLNIGIGARACAIGKAYAAIANDPSTIYWNPSGLSEIEERQIMFINNFWLLDMTGQYLAGVFSSKFGYFGISSYYSNSGEIPEIENFLKVGQYRAYDAVINLAYTNKLVNTLSLGITAKYIMQKIEKESASCWALDLGSKYSPNFLPDVNFAFVIKNIGPKIKFIQEGSPLPLNFVVAAAYQRPVFSVGCQMDWIKDRDPVIGLGGEYIILEILALRTGYNTASSFSFGGGIFWKKFTFNYAYVPYEKIDNTHQIGIILQF